MKLSIIIPLYNEAPTVREVMERVTRAPLPPGLAREIIVVDDGSNDATKTILGVLQKEFEFRLMHLTPNQGKGQALRQGIAACTGDIVVFQDCDLEYDPDDYGALVTPILDGRADVVYGSRFLAPERNAISPLFRTANKVLTALSNLSSGLRLTDMETGYKAFKGDLLRGIDLRENRFGIEPEITAKVARLVRTSGSRVTEVPVRYRARSYAQGKKIGFIDGVRSLWCIAKYNLKPR